MAVSKTLCLLVIACIACSASAASRSGLTRTGRKFLSNADAVGKCQSIDSAYWNYDQNKCVVKTYAVAAPYFSRAEVIVVGVNGNNVGVVQGSAEGNGYGSNSYTSGEVYVTDSSVTATGRSHASGGK